MKRSMFMVSFLVVVVGTSVLAGPPGPPVGPYRKVLEVPGTKDEIFIKAMRWMTKTFRSAEAVIQYQDKEAGIITGNGNVDLQNKVAPMYLNFVLTIEIKDGRVRLSFENLTSTMFVMKETKTMPVYEGPGVDAELHKRLDPIIESFRQEMDVDDDF